MTAFSRVIAGGQSGYHRNQPGVEIRNSRPEKLIDKKVRVITTITYFLDD